MNGKSIEASFTGGRGSHTWAITHCLIDALAGSCIRGEVDLALGMPLRDAGSPSNSPTRVPQRPRAPSTGSSTLKQRALQFAWTFQALGGMAPRTGLERHHGSR